MSNSSPKASDLRILFDKNAPYRLRRFLAQHEVLTADQSLKYQQNLRGRKLALIVLSTNHLGVLELHPEKLTMAVDTATEGSFEFVRYELPPKPKPGSRGSSI